MKAIIKITPVFALLFIAILWISCDPMEVDKPSLSAAPAGSEVNFTIEAGSDDFHFIIKNTSTATGIPNWNLGNGSKASGHEITAYYPLPGTYTVSLTLYAEGGSMTVTQDIEQTKTDYSLFNDEKFIALSGGVDAINGKTWVLDSLNKGHIGVGPVDASEPIWWAAAPLVKTEVGMYDDEINFNLNDFVVTYKNNGYSYVKSFQKDNPAYVNPVLAKDDYMVEYVTPVTGTWNIVEKEGSNFLTMKAATPIFPIFDTGAKNDEYEIIYIDENQLKLKAIGGDDLGWFYTLIPKGYKKPTIEFEATAVETGNANEYSIALDNVEVPDGDYISEINVTFGDGESDVLADENATVAHSYMKKGTYTVTVTVINGAGDSFVETVSVSVAENHPDYVPPAEYVEDGMAMFANFDNIFSKIGVDQADGTASFQLVPNPSVDELNGSGYCIDFTKVEAQWSNIYILLSEGFRFDLTVQSKFKLLVYGTAGTKVLLKMENTDLGGNAWQTGTEITYTIQEDNTWEIAEYDFNGVGNNGSAEPVATDVVADPATNTGYYNVVRVMVNPGDNAATYNVLLDDWAGPLVEGWKKK